MITPELIIIFILASACLIQCIYFLLVFSKICFYKPEAKNYNRQSQVAVSIIICGKNEAKNIEKNLPSILGQQYLNFEVVFVNDGS